MKKIYLLAVFVFAVSVSAQDMRNNAFNSLFSDQKANQVGDAITILVIESSQASNNSETSAGRNSDLGLGFSGAMDGTNLPSGEAGITSKNDFRGSGSTRTTGMVRTTISATIDSVLANGNLRITGSRHISINGEVQKIHIKGIVRLSDIGPDNTVSSQNISDAEIVMEGEGMIDRSQHPGWLTRFFHWLF